MAQIDPHSKSDLIALFHEHQENIREGKREQWRGIYYAFLVLAGIFGFLTIRSSLTFEECLFAMAFYAAVITFVAYYVWRWHRAIVRQRERTQEVRSKFSADFMQVLRAARSNRDQEFPIVFSTVLWITAGFLFWYILSRNINTCLWACMLIAQGVLTGLMYVACRHLSEITERRR